MVQRFAMREKLEEDAMAILHRVGPQAFEPPFQRVCPQPSVKRVRSEDLILFSGECLDGRREIAEGALEMRRDVNPHDLVRNAAQASSSFSERTVRVLPLRCAQRPTVTRSRTSSAVSRRLRDIRPIWPRLTACHGIRMTSASSVSETVGVCFMSAPTPFTSFHSEWSDHRASSLPDEPRFVNAITQERCPARFLLQKNVRHQDVEVR